MISLIEPPVTPKRRRRKGSTSFLDQMSSPAFVVSQAGTFRDVFEVIICAGRAQAFLVPNKITEAQIKMLFSMAPDNWAISVTLTKQWKQWAVIASPIWAASQNTKDITPKPTGMFLSFI